MEMISHLKVYNLVDNFQFSEKQNPEKKKKKTVLDQLVKSVHKLEKKITENSSWGKTLLVPTSY